MYVSVLWILSMEWDYYVEWDYYSAMKDLGSKQKKQSHLYFLLSCFPMIFNIYYLNKLSAGYDQIQGCATSQLFF